MKEELEKVQIEIKSQKPKVISNIPKSDYHPVKDIIKDLEKEKPSKEKCSKEMFEVSEDKVMELNKTNETKNEEKILPCKETQIIPPKPLPRASRTGSICEPMDESVNIPKPVARPRTNSCAPTITSVNPNIPIAGGYKVLFQYLY